MHLRISVFDMMLSIPDVHSLCQDVIYSKSIPVLRQLSDNGALAYIIFLECRLALFTQMGGTLFVATQQVPASRSWNSFTPVTVPWNAVTLTGDLCSIQR
jgi:hypothetical protein